jgi:hypothetical protein
MRNHLKKARDNVNSFIRGDWAPQERLLAYKDLMHERVPTIFACQFHTKLFSGIDSLFEVIDLIVE